MTEFLLLLLAHVLVDFYWQPTSWVIDKKKKSLRSKYLYFHVLLVIAISYILLGKWDNPMPVIVLGIAHGIIDIVKIKFDKKGTLTWFIADQAAHLITIIIATLIITNKLNIGFETFKTWLYTPKTLAILSGALLSLSPISFLVGILTKPWREELTKLAPDIDDNLANAGRWIGMSERLLIFVFVLVSQFSAIGFLIAAKSLLRYNDKTAGGEIPPAYISKKSEYVLVGTLMSYTCAIAVALAVKMLY
ncbi:DUF3307 domain-containing protein [Dyadobacter pollutisoli]|jgi:hypothetical protein|uniref:DUF3307 domain-containing protein n=1 Tax=Dyadobacter pollutisoli TaxID=2910158 RepID=A0A9E8N841_9BACT|nr:DUF3307 domain-containing protein [Dyadobacter pollutisoli]WAC09639.1 DUF3307 domain-containing protein [Dyadobacter pollutisoli]